MQNCWDTMSPPFPEKDLNAAWYAAILNVPKRIRGILYVGRVTNRFLSEENGSFDCLKLYRLKLASGLSSTILEEPPEQILACNCRPVKNHVCGKKEMQISWILEFLLLF